MKRVQSQPIKSPIPSTKCGQCGTNVKLKEDSGGKRGIIVYINNESVKCSAGADDFGSWSLTEWRQNMSVRGGFTCQPNWCKAFKYDRTAHNTCLLPIHWFLDTLNVITVSSPQSLEVIFGTPRGHKSNAHFSVCPLRRRWSSWEVLILPGTKASRPVTIQTIIKRRRHISRPLPFSLLAWHSAR